MPYCPECKYEYNPGIKTCPDCYVSLVDELPAEESNDLRDVELVCVASYPFAAQAQGAQLMLESHGVRSVLGNDIMSQTDYSVVLADGGVKVYVAAEDAERAAALLQ